MMKCNNCYYIKRIHPMQRHKDGGMKAVCTLGVGGVSEESLACEEFKDFIGWVYR